MAFKEAIYSKAGIEDGYWIDDTVFGFRIKRSPRSIFVREVLGGSSDSLNIAPTKKAEIAEEDFLLYSDWHSNH